MQTKNKTKKQLETPQNPSGELDTDPLHNLGALASSDAGQMYTAIYQVFSQASLAASKSSPIVERGINKKTEFLPVVTPVPRVELKRDDPHETKASIYDRLTVPVMCDLGRYLYSLVDDYCDEVAVIDDPGSLELCRFDKKCPHLTSATKMALKDRSGLILAFAFTVMFLDDSEDRPAFWDASRSWQTSAFMHRRRTYKRLAKKVLRTIEE
ncbi:hypothetical protein CMQ_5153 [Grosmannia clavigera kw1407]|uniref:Uncharacterized protein n=1 Tax=Grosmannia clavigera (strain kw1407 / UAMH 11150) TaxID=655863 RepID=F0XB34_GROCL|nr:uncharacterized protein CMQ_5153 [Grosmannia clavigera kw1407]EFX04891.1 hypothetical protein CMQ_5153 [Grosmannia clavigera kw1407]